MESVAVQTETLQTTPVAQNAPVEPGRDLPQRLIAGRVPDVPADSDAPSAPAGAPTDDGSADASDDTEGDSDDTEDVLGAGSGLLE